MNLNTGPRPMRETTPAIAAQLDDLYALADILEIAVTRAPDGYREPGCVYVDPATLRISLSPWAVRQLAADLFLV